MRCWWLALVLACDKDADDSGPTGDGGADGGGLDGGGLDGGGDGGGTDGGSDGGGGDGGEDPRGPYWPTMGFIQVEPGTFTMGTPATDPWVETDELAHEVTLTSGFEVSPFEVSRGEFEILVGWQPATWNDGCATCPVESVTWYDAIAFLNAYSRQNGLATCYALDDVTCQDGTTGDEEGACAANGGIAAATVGLVGISRPQDCAGYRLPTEAEWERAARAGATGNLHTGQLTVPGCDPDPLLAVLGWTCATTGSLAPRDRADLDANAWGMYDTLGNVYEWCGDGYLAVLGEDPVVDPLGDEGGDHRVVRGGSWINVNEHARLGNRSAYAPGSRDHSVGLRVFRSAW
ncbi:formylglycine-generating enzyme family protein [Myxococcota bacterium]|nr:formylglycine-generating enzyme family protein [Myxococcota bacterium]